LIFSSSFFPESAGHRIRQGREIFHVANQMCPAELQHRTGLGGEAAVLTGIVATHHSGERLAQELLENVGAFRGIDVKEGESLGAGSMEAPDVELFAVFQDVRCRRY